MSSILRKGKRLELRRKIKEDKLRVKEIINIIAELDKVAKQISENEKTMITEDNIEEIASKYTKRKIGGYEKMMLLVKLEELGTVNKEDILDEN